MALEIMTGKGKEVLTMQYDIPHIRKQMLDSGDAHLVHLCRELNDEKLRMVLDIVRDVNSKKIEAEFAKIEGCGA